MEEKILCTFWREDKFSSNKINKALKVHLQCWEQQKINELSVP